MNNNLKRYIEITRQSKLTDFQINFYDEIGIKTINDFKKSEQYQAISDMSKELHGSRLRLDIDKYSLEELIEMTNDFASQIIERNDRRANKSTEDFVLDQIKN